MTEHYRTVVRNDDKGNPVIEYMKRTFSTGNKFSTEDGAVYKQMGDGSIRRVHKTKVSKKARRKLKEEARKSVKAVKVTTVTPD